MRRGSPLVSHAWKSSQYSLHIRFNKKKIMSGVVTRAHPFREIEFPSL